jgi:2-oxoglutarate dehydrogenase E2 component (dihydrolipoamide succinyltransferase)
MEIRVPTLGESVTEATIAQWYKAEGESVSVDEPLVELETDKVTIEVPAPSSGTLSEILVQDGETVEVGALLGSIGEGAAASVSVKEEEQAPTESEAPAAVETKVNGSAEDHTTDDLPPATRRVVVENNLDASTIQGTGRGGRITKGDALKALETGAAPVEAKAPTPTGPRDQSDREERVPMTRLRRTIATRLKEAQNTAAMLTTFNEVDMTNVMALRKEYKELFEKKHGVRLGFMGFFVKACISALQDIPAVNAEIEGDDLVYKNYYNIGVAVGTDRGLVVPVVRDADRLSLGGVELAINEFGRKARDGKIGLDDLQGGTFTISNGGVYGSLMSTPILNRPQSGILGMHKIQERPVVIDGEVQVRPMMYLALSYDHRIVDGKEAVTFLVRVKECLEGPERLLLDL